MYLQSYLRTATAVIGLYDGSVPFAVWLKGYFGQHKKFGSRDRKTIAGLCFCYFRLGGAFANETVEEQLLIGQFLCQAGSPFVQEWRPAQTAASSLPVKEKLVLLGPKVTGAFFPFLDETSSEVNKEAFNLAHLFQPDLFLRTRPGKRETVFQKLRAASVSFSAEDDCVRLANATKLDGIVALDQEAVVQDRSSQRVLQPLQSGIRNRKSEMVSAWDCCAASGGKSLLLHDLFPKIALAVSDVRESILHNLTNRFRQAGIKGYQSFVADVSSPAFRLHKKFDVVICDAPCSGSGTWGRTPEQLRFFQKEKIAYYASLQKAIAGNAGKCVKEGGLFLYITCSVFQKENEAVVEYIRQETPLRLLEQDYIKGYDEKADTMFVALFTTDSQTVKNESAEQTPAVDRLF